MPSNIRLFFSTAGAQLTFRDLVLRNKILVSLGCSVRETKEC